MLRRTWLQLVAFSPVFMPSLSPSMESGRIVEWKKQVGDAVNEGDVWCTVETDKATVDFTNTVDVGFVAAQYFKNGDRVTVGKTIAVLVEDAADVSKASEYRITDTATAAAAIPVAVKDAVAPPPPPSPVTTPAVAAQPKRYGSSLDDALRASGPSVMRIAASVVDKTTLESVRPSGKNGRFLKSDFAHLPQFDYETATVVASASASSSVAETASTKKPSTSALMPSAAFVSLRPTPVVNFTVSDSRLIRSLISKK